MIAVSQQRNALRPIDKPSFRMTKSLFVMLLLLAALEPPAHASTSTASAIDDMGHSMAAFAQGLSEMTAPQHIARLQFGTVCTLPVMLPAPATLAGPVAGPTGQVDVRQLRCISVLAPLEIGVRALGSMADTNVIRDASVAVSPSIVAQTSVPFSMDASASAPVSAAAGDAVASAAKLPMLAECGEDRACVEQAAPVSHEEILQAEPSSQTSSSPSVDPLAVLFGAQVLIALGLLGLLALGCWTLYSRQFTPQARLVRAAKKGLRRGEFCLEYQPVISLRRGKCVGIEAVLRWGNLEFGLLGPAHYMNHLERSKVTGPLTRFMLATAASEIATLNAAKSLYIAVKVSAAHMAADNFVSEVRDSAKGLLPRLVLEVTESDCADVTSRVLESLEALRKDGVRFALAGAGLDPVNFRLLRTFDFELIKMDREVLALDSDERVSRLAAMSDVAHSVGAMVVADGVENAAHHQALSTSRTDLGQGFFYSRSLTIGRLEAFLESGGPSRLAGRIHRKRDSERGGSLRPRSLTKTSNSQGRGSNLT
ncbi:EAL domain-containing protein [Paraburkholderia dipogonis]|uniref:EAL domain-containing protein n=1 Tax=Paraburkholderia dipogonis TaxID=1211383 RepID=UPI0038BCC782